MYKAGAAKESRLPPDLLITVKVCWYRFSFFITGFIYTVFDYSVAVADPDGK